MTVSVPNSIPSLTGATSHDKMDWHNINWPKVHREVQRLQARIVQAELSGKRGKVKALQRLLTHSFSGKALAVKRVSENQGKNTPGVDRETWNTPQKKITAVHQLKHRGYQAQPLRRVYIKKSNGKLRPLGIPCMKCRAMQALYLLALDPIAQVRADPDSYGFRRGRSCADAIEQCFITLASRHKPQWILEGDIHTCFDKINHSWLIANIPIDKAILQKWLKAGFVYKKVLYPTQEGSPQGSIISPVLANMTLDGLETKLKQAFFIFDYLPRHQMEEQVEECALLVRPQDNSHYDFLLSSFKIIRSFSVKLLEAFTFHSNPTAAPLLTALQTLRDFNRSSNRKLSNHSTLAFVPAKWMNYVLEDNGSI